MKQTDNLKGNCVDKFLDKRIQDNAEQILTTLANISVRIKERSETNDYFNTGCYEQDFSDIRKLKEASKKIFEECSKFLERISEQYSKLN